MNARLTTLSLAALCLIAVFAFAGQDQRSKTDDDADTTPERDRWMAVKLASAQQILADLTSGDFERLETSARRMQVMNFLENWQRDENFSNKSGYQGQLNAFEFANKELIRHAQDKNTDGALKAYVGLTESCVHCHQLIRDDQAE